MYSTPYTSGRYRSASFEYLVSYWKWPFQTFLSYRVGRKFLISDHWELGGQARGSIFRDCGSIFRDCHCPRNAILWRTLCQQKIILFYLACLFYMTRKCKLIPSTCEAVWKRCRTRQSRYFLLVRRRIFRQFPRSCIADN